MDSNVCHGARLSPMKLRPPDSLLIEAMTQVMVAALDLSDHQEHDKQGHPRRSSSEFGRIPRDQRTDGRDASHAYDFPPDTTDPLTMRRSKSYSRTSSGELSPQALGRVDISRYPNAAKTLSNVISRTLWRCTKRPGLQYVAPAKVRRPVPGSFPTSSVATTRLGNTYLRVQTDGTQVESSPGVPYEIRRPMTPIRCREIDYSRGEDTMYVFHEDVYPQRRAPSAMRNGTFLSAPFTTMPFC